VQWGDRGAGGGGWLGGVKENKKGRHLLPGGYKKGGKKQIMSYMKKLTVEGSGEGGQSRSHMAEKHKAKEKKSNTGGTGEARRRRGGVREPKESFRSEIGEGKWKITAKGGGDTTTIGGNFG